MAEKNLPVIAVNHNKKGVARIDVVILNMSREPVYFGETYSVLGYDQFIVVVDTDSGRIELNRDIVLFSPEQLTPFKIPSGSFKTVTFDFNDGTWKCENHKPKDFGSWKSIKVMYRPKQCRMQKSRKDKGVYDSEFESRWVDLPTSQ